MLQIVKMTTGPLIVSEKVYKETAWFGSPPTINIFSKPENPGDLAINQPVRDIGVVFLIDNS